MLLCEHVLVFQGFARICKTPGFAGGCLFPLSLKMLYGRSSYLQYNQNKHCGFVAMFLQPDCSEVTQITVACLK